MTRPNETGKIFVVDDDEAMRESLAFLLESVDLEPVLFDSAQAFLDRHGDGEPPEGCLLLDVRMPGMSGLDLQDELRERGLEIPIVIMTAHADVPMAVRAMHQGALDFLEKPFNDQDLLDRLHRALDRDRELRRAREERRVAAERVERLTPREREVMEGVVRGRLNKQIAGDLNLAVKTVEQYRAQVMRKMEADSLADLVRMAFVLGIS